MHVWEPHGVAEQSSCTPRSDEPLTCFLLSPLTRTFPYLSKHGVRRLRYQSAISAACSWRLCQASFPMMSLWKYHCPSRASQPSTVSFGSSCGDGVPFSPATTAFDQPAVSAPLHDLSERSR